MRASKFWLANRGFCMVYWIRYGLKWENAVKEERKRLYRSRRGGMAVGSADVKMERVSLNFAACVRKSSKF